MRGSGKMRFEIILELSRFGPGRCQGTYSFNGSTAMINGQDRLNESAISRVVGHTVVRRLKIRTSGTQTAMLGLSCGRNDEKAASRVMRLAPSRPYDKPFISECT